MFLKRRLRPLFISRARRAELGGKLAAAAQDGQLERARVLIAEGADLNYAGGGIPALHYAVACRYFEIAKLLLESGADPNVGDSNGAPPLQKAATADRIDYAKLLLKHGADVNRADKDGWNPLIAAAWYDAPEMVSLLAASGATAAARTKGGETALSIAERNSSEETISRLKAEALRQETILQHPLRVSGPLRFRR